jgi:hypothetical protein
VRCRGTVLEEDLHALDGNHDSRAEEERMAEVIVRIDGVLVHSSGGRYTAQVCGRQVEDGRLWEGWIEFVPLDGGTVRRTPRETEQSSRDDLAYWATGLSTTYLEGALDRALDSEPLPPPPPPRAHAAYGEPAPSRAVTGSPRPVAPPPSTPRAVLNPFDVYRQGEHILRRELSALHPEHLQAIIRAHALIDADAVDVEAMTRSGLAELIVAAVRGATR